MEILTQSNVVTKFISEKDNGIYDAMNKGILKSFGNYLLFLNSGDYLCENVLGKVFSETHNEDILYGNMKINWGVNNITDGIMPNKITLEHLVKDTLWHPVSFIKKELFNKLTEAGIISDWREPNVIRCAPVPLYNSFEDVWRFGEILKGVL